VAAAGPPRLPFAWQAQHTEPFAGGAVRVAAAGPRLPFAWQAEKVAKIFPFCGFQKLD